MLKVNFVMRHPGKVSLVLRHFQPVRGMRLRAITGFPLLSTGRGIKGEGWGLSELPAFVLLSISIAMFLSPLRAAETHPTDKQGYELHPALEMALFAKEPDVADPVA